MDKDKQLQAKRLTEFSLEIMQWLERLLIQLSPERKLSQEILEKALKSPNTYLFGLFDKNKMIGTGTLIVMNTFPSQRGYIHDLVIDQEYRGRGLAKIIMNEIISTAKELKLVDIELTSRPKRGTADFFQKFGFQKRETNVFKIDL